jgi:hypothetical protein
MEAAIIEHGAPRQLISDHGIQFISSDGHKPVHLQQRLTATGIRQLSPRPAHPQTCGKLRCHRTFKDFYPDYPDQRSASIVDEPHALCDQFCWHNSHQRPTRAWGQQLPAEVDQTLPKVGSRDLRPHRRKTGHGSS